jgi:hypothetical protein
MKVQFPNFPHDRTDTRPLPWLAIWLTGVIVMSSIPLHADEVAPYWAGQRLLLDWEEDEVTTPVMTSVVMNPATGQVAAGGDDHLVRIWDLESGARQHLLEATTTGSERSLSHPTEACWCRRATMAKSCSGTHKRAS